MQFTYGKRFNYLHAFKFVPEDIENNVIRLDSDFNEALFLLRLGILNKVFALKNDNLISQKRP